MADTERVLRDGSLGPLGKIGGCPYPVRSPTLGTKSAPHLLSNGGRTVVGERMLKRIAEEDKKERSYRVEHRDRHRTRVLGRLADAFVSHHTLEPFLSRLLQDGARHGQLILVDDATGRVVARRAVRLPRRVTPDRTDRGGPGNDGEAVYAAD